MSGFLKRNWTERKVLRSAGIYAVVAWVVIQIADATFPALMMPEWTVRIVIVLALLGLPLVVVLAWAQDSSSSSASSTSSSPPASGTDQPVVSPLPSSAALVDEEAIEATSLDPLPERPTLAVLPFSNMSSDGEQQHLADSLTEDLITDLSKTGVLEVIARNSVFQYRGQSVDVRAAGQALGAHLILEGSVRKARDVVRFTAQLIDARNGHHLWADRQDRDITDVLRIQDEMCEQISEGVIRALGYAPRADHIETAEPIPASPVDESGDGFSFKFSADGDDQTLYARSGDLNIAYKVTGQGPPDIVYVPGIVSHLELFHQLPTPPEQTFMVQVLGERARVVGFDKRGQGLSDPIIGNPGLDERLDDMLAVMDAAGVGDSIICGVSEGGPLSILFASTYPERVKGLIIQASFPRFAAAPDFPQGMPEDAFSAMEDQDDFTRAIAMRETLMPGIPREKMSDAEWVAMSRIMVSRTNLDAAGKMIQEIDVRPLLATLQVPTLVVHSRSDAIPFGLAEYMVDHIPGAELLALDDCGHAFVPDTQDFRDELWKFIDRAAATSPVATDSVLATVLAVEGLVSDDIPRAQAALAQGSIKTHIDETAGRAVTAFDRPARAMRCAMDLAKKVESPLIIGLDTGLVEISDQAIGGPAVEQASAAVQNAGDRQVMLTSTLKDLLSQTGLTFRPVNLSATDPGAAVQYFEPAAES